MTDTIIYKELSLTDDELQDTVNLLKVCFPTSDKFSFEYLDWLYVKNPAGKAVGFNAYCNDKLVGHYSCTPLFANVHGTLQKGLLSLNTATEPAFQGKGLFRKLANETYKVATDLGYEFVCGVANSRSTTLFVKLLKFKLISPLEVKVGYGNYFKHLSKDVIESNCEFYPVWNKKTINWRASNPHNKCYSLSNCGVTNRFSAPTQYVFIKNEGFCYYEDPINYTIEREGLLNKLKPKIVLSLVPKVEKNKCNLYFSIPEKYKPSPLNFIFKSLSDNKVELNSTNVLFSFIDFDAY